jgi:hypothetical protein
MRAGSNERHYAAPNLPHCLSAQPLPDVPLLRRRSAHQPLVLMQHLSLWDSLPFTGKVSYAAAEQTLSHRITLARP